MQVVRALAFLGVFFSHLPNSGILSSGGAWGVSVFCVLSGFVMTYQHFESEKISRYSLLDSFKFAAGKIKKLYSLHILMMILMLPYAYREEKALSIFSASDFITEIIAHTFLIQSWFPVDKIHYSSLNTVSWYLSMTVMLYIAFPFILKFIKKIRSTGAALSFILAAYAAQICLGFLSWQISGTADIYIKSFSHSFYEWFIYIFPLSRFWEFFIGCCLGFIFMKKNHEKFSKLEYTVAEAAVFILIVLELIIGDKADTAWWSLVSLYVPTSAALVYLFTERRGAISIFLTKKPLIYLGNITPYTYLIHWIVIRYWGVILKRVGLNFLTVPLTFNFIFAFVFTIIFAELWRKRDKITPFYKKFRTLVFN